jgi:hypothetical protein
MMTEHQLSHAERRDILDSLVDLGACDAREAAIHLRRTIDDHQAGENAVYWALRQLADFGPEYQDEVAEHLFRLADDPLVTGYERKAALGRLAEFGEPHRIQAISRLRRDLTDPDVAPARRCDAADQLSRLDPRFHAEVVKNLLDVLTGDLRPYDASRAWQLLAKLDNRHDEAAAAAQLELLTTTTSTDAYSDFVSVPPRIIAEDLDRAVDTLLRVLADTKLSFRAREHAFTELGALHRRFHEPLLNAAIELWDDRPGEIAHVFTRTASRVRARLADHIHAVIGASAVTEGAQALVRLGHFNESTASLVRGAMLDHAEDPDVRIEAATLLAGVEPHRIREAIDFAADITLHWSPSSWRYTLLSLARLGGDVTAHAATQLTGDADCDTKQESAELLIDLHGEPDQGAIRELQRLAGDVHLTADQRRYAFMALARFEPATDAINYLESVVHDRDAPVAERGRAAHGLVRLDRAQWRRCVAALKRMLIDSAVTVDEQADLVERLDRLNALRQAEIDKFNLAVVHHPSASAPTRRSALRRATDRTKHDIARELVEDTATPVAVRLPGYAEPNVADVVITAAREVLTAIEWDPGDRVAAAVALAGASSQAVPEVVEALTRFALQPRVRFRALRALADRGTPYRREVRSRALDVVGDEAEPLHARFRAVELIIDLFRVPPAEVVEFLRRVAADERTSSRWRLDAMFRLRHVDGLDGVRAMRDDERVPAAIRWLAATKLVDYRPEDRVKGAELLRKIAADTAQRPALRCAAASDLVQFGKPGREQAAAIAHVMAVDVELPTTSRIRAAEVLAEAARSRRPEVLGILRELGTAEKPLHRLRALQAIAALAPLEATHPLRAMARDRGLPPLMRLRSAEALVVNHREHRESAVIAAREVAFDERLPEHVRVRAARDLARWSEVFRDDARRLLHVLLER